ncbi:MAG TPA: FliH/SctL family protein [Anaeromyxobacter sp.]|nr:FliH/SctL family protein [Anaeromyxobacter sp.]
MTATARILKDGAPLPAARIPAAVHDADRRVREMIASAQARALEIVSEAEAARDRIVAEALEEGRRAGLARAGAAIAAAVAARDRRLAAVERELAAIALDVAAALVGGELAAREDAVVALAARALAEARERRDVTLRVHPDDARAVRSAEGRLGAILARAPLSVREDPALPRGGVVVETDAGWIDARIETQLADLRRAVEEELP